MKFQFRVSKEIQSLVPYKPGKPISDVQRELGLDHVVKLASNENPLGTNPKVVQALRGALSDLHRYPDPGSFDALSALSRHFQIPAKNITIGNGSNELIDLLIRIFCEPQDSILTSQAAFVAYSVCAQAARVKVLRTPLKPNFDVDMEGLELSLSELRGSEKIKIVFFPNPNNPTGRLIPRPAIQSFLSRWGNQEDLLIVFDEAYHEFVRSKDYESAVHYLSQNSNVVVLRTLSKAFGLAGLRVGVLLAHEDVVALVNKVRNPFNMNHLAQVATVVALDDHEFVQKSCAVTWEGLDYFYRELKDMGLPFVSSEGNFVLFDTQRDALTVDQALLQKGVILRPVGNYGFPHHLRMSVGLKSENEFAIQKLKEYFQKK